MLLQIEKLLHLQVLLHLPLLECFLHHLITSGVLKVYESVRFDSAKLASLLL